MPLAGASRSWRWNFVTAKLNYGLWKTEAVQDLGQGFGGQQRLTIELDTRRANYFQGLIGILRWMCDVRGSYNRLEIVVLQAVHRFYAIAGSSY